MNYETIICFETHVELKTRSKLFCDCPVSFDAPPNSQTCPVCTGQPGALPVLNKKAVEYAIRAGLALNCTVNTQSRFARKNYFYPDLPKGYQISQYERPFCENGVLEITGDSGKPYPVGIKRIHLEEDAGKLVHSADAMEEAQYSLVDYNRSSVPLLEIVCDHERNPLRSLEEAHAYLEKIRQTLRYIDISDCQMEKGQLRCDVNISIRPKGSDTFGNRTEIKNMSSFRFMMDAIAYEIERQAELLESGEEVVQETRLFDESKRITLPMRSKEDAPDYRYFPDPDLMEIEIDDEFLHKIKSTMPELPDQKVDRIVERYGIPRNDALALTKDRHVSDFFESCASQCEDSRKLGTWMIKDLFRLLNEASFSIQVSPVPPEDFAHLVNLISQGEITEKIGRTVLDEMFATSKKPEIIIEEKALRPIQDTETLEKILLEIFEEHPNVAAQVKSGDTKPIDFIIGQVMRRTKGKANAKIVRDLIQPMLSP